MRPLTSGWQNAGTRALVSGKKDVTSEDWEAFLANHDKMMKEGVDATAFCDALEKNLKPVKEAISSAAMRKELGQRVQIRIASSLKAQYTLMTGDRVVCANDQYTSKTGSGKFLHRDGDLKQYTVLKVDGGIIEIEEMGSGMVTKKHESQLKLMPKILPPRDILAAGQDVPVDVSRVLQRMAFNYIRNQISNLQ